MRLFLNNIEVFNNSLKGIKADFFDSIPDDILFYKNHYYCSIYNMKEQLPKTIIHIINTTFQINYINIFSSDTIDWYLSKLGILDFFNTLTFQKEQNGQLVTISFKELGLMHILDPMGESIIQENIIEYINSLKKLHPRTLWKAIEKVLSGNITSLVRGRHSEIELERIFSNNMVQFIIGKNYDQFAKIMTLCKRSDILKYTKYYMEFKDGIEECWITFTDGKRYINFSNTFNENMFLTIQEHDFLGYDCMEYDWFCLDENDCLDANDCLSKQYIIEFMCNLGLHDYTMLEIKTVTGNVYIPNNVILRQFKKHLNIHYSLFAPLPLHKKTDCSITNKILEKQFFVLTTLDITTAEVIMSNQQVQKVLFNSYYQYRHDPFISIFHVLAKKNRFDIVMLIINKLSNREWWKSKSVYKWVRLFFSNGFIGENRSNYEYDDIYTSYIYDNACVLTTLIESEYISDNALIYMHDTLLNLNIWLNMEGVELQSYDYDNYDGDFYRALTNIAKYIITNRPRYVAYLACMGVTEFSYTAPLLRQNTEIYKFIYSGSIPNLFTKDLYKMQGFEIHNIYRQEYNSIFAIYTMIYNRFIVNGNFCNMFYNKELFILIISYLLDDYYYTLFMDSFII